MATLREAISESVQNFMCAAATSADPFRSWMAQATSSVPGVGAAAAASDDFGDVVGALVCPGPGGGMSGGGGAGATYPPAGSDASQCPVLLSATVTWTGDTLQQPGPVIFEQGNVNTFAGPILGERLDTPTVNPNRWSLFITYGDGVERELTFINYQSNATPEYSIEWTPLSTPPPGCVIETPQGPPTGTDVITYDGPDGNPVIDAPITITPVFPIIGPGGILNIPIEVCLLALCFEVNFNVSTGEITFNFGGTPGSSPCCPDVEEPEIVPDDDDPPPPQSDKRLWGIKVNAAINGPGYCATERTDGDGEALYLPDLGFVRFAISIGGYTGWTEKVAVQTLSQFIPVPAPATAYAYDLFERPGVTLSAKEVIVKSSEMTAEM